MKREFIANTEWRRRAIRYAPFLLWIGVILYLGSAQGSMSETSRFIGPLLRFLFPDAAPETLLAYHGYVRKFAHFAEYAVLAYLAVRAFRGSDSSILRNGRFAFALLAVAAVASFDEYLQSYNPSRTASPYDVALDIFGGLTAVIGLWIVQKRTSRPSA